MFELKTTDESITLLRITTLMAERNHTHVSLAKIVGYPESTVRSWLCGKMNIPASCLEKMADALGVTTDYLYGITDYKTEDARASAAQQERVKAVAAAQQIQKAKMERGARIRRIREDSGLTRAEVAKRINRTVSAIDQWESGLRNPRRSTLEKLAVIYGVSVTKLTREPDEQTKYAKDVYAALLNLGFTTDGATAFLDSIPDSEQEPDNG